MIQIKFTHNISPLIQKKVYFYQESWTIKQMLEDFLNQTNSKKTLKPNEISFIIGSNILNTEKNLEKTLKEVFKNNKMIKPIKIIDSNNVIGGNIC